MNHTNQRIGPDTWEKAFQASQRYPNIENIYTKAWASWGDGIIATDEAAIKALVSACEELERAAKRIISRHSRLWWFMQWHEKGSDICWLLGWNPAFTVWVIFRGLALSLKYGNIRQRDLRDTGSALAYQLKFDDLVDLLRLVRLASEYTRMAESMKAVGNGASIRLSAKQPELIRHDSQIAADLLENRRFEEAQGVPFGELGIPETLSEPTPDVLKQLRDRSRPVFPSAVVWLTKDKPSIPVSTDVGVLNRQMRYHPVAIDLRPLMTDLQIRGSQVSATIGLQAEEIIAGLWSFGGLFADHWESLRLRLNFSHGGIATFSARPAEEFIAQALEELYPKLCGGKKPPLDLAARLVAAMVLKERQMPGIDVLSLRPVGVMYELGAFWHFSGALANKGLTQFLNQVQLDTEQRQAKGSQFEEDVARLLQQRLGERVKLVFGPRHKLRKGDRVLGEIDLAPAVGEVLFLVECKCYTYTESYLNGDRKERNKRWGYLEDWLHQVDTTAKHLVEMISEELVTMPKDIKFIVPVVCTPWVEYIWPVDDFHMMTDQIPRVCTIYELVNLLGGSMEKLLKKPFVLEAGMGEKYV